MDVSPRNRRGSCLVKWALMCLLAAAGASRAQELRFESAGARFGFPANASSRGFLEADAFVNWKLPWAWELGREWRLETRLDLSAGWLGSSKRDGGLGEVGPMLTLGHGRFPLGAEAGVEPTVLTRTKFGTGNEARSKDFGLPFQFTSHIGLYYDVAKRVRLGYRFQHMSNAGLGSPNPGLTLHVFYASYLF
jgi:lipid A 3-O-deacylase